ncbi:hypothetical protein AGMMS50276_17470 [Synergistales bacterium]|nr:hypothetical protein AGMMS50276_17470 [Synergistales bacterium]
MIFTILGVLSRWGVNIEDTPYAAQNEINSYAFDALDFFSVAGIEKYKMDFAESRKRELSVDDIKRGEAYIGITSAIKAIKDRLITLSEYGRENSLFQSAVLTEEGNAVAGETKRLRAEKARLLSKAERLVSLSSYALKYDSVLTYKNALLCNSLRNMRLVLPELGGMDAGRLENIPIFTRSFGKLAAKLGGKERERGESLAVVGGPCLLGTGEMVIRVIHSDGFSFCFDFNTRNRVGDLSKKDAIGAHIRENAGKVVKILFETKKHALTLQDYEFIKAPMVYARALDAPVVIPLPDGAYIKYIEALTSPLVPELRNSARGDFAIEIRRLTKMFLSAIEDLARSLRPSKLEVLHIDNKAALDTFSEGKERYRGKLVSRRGLMPITKDADMVESVTDYIFYPALPFYLWGVKNILQVDSLRETDAMCKCAQAHGGVINLFGALFPEMLDKSGSRPTSNAPVQDKEYML